MTREELLRFERGLTARQVYEGAGISAKTLDSFEAGDRVSAPVARKLADFYGMTVQELLGLGTGVEPEHDAA